MEDNIRIIDLTPEGIERYIKDHPEQGSLSKYIVGFDPYVTKFEEGERIVATIVIKRGNNFIYSDSKRMNNPEEFSKLCKEWVEDINNRVPEINAKLVKDGK